MVAWLLTRWSDMLPMGVKWATKAANAAEGITAPLYPISEARILGRGDSVPPTKSLPLCDTKVVE